MGLAESVTTFYAKNEKGENKFGLKTANLSSNTSRYNTKEIIKDNYSDKNRNFTELESHEDKAAGGCCKGGKCIIF